MSQPKPDDKLELMCQQFDEVVKQCSFDALRVRGRLGQMFALADGMERLRSLITPDFMAKVMRLQGTAIGFRTDKDKSGGYKAQEVTNVLIEAMIRGLYPINNEFNIIAGNLYVAKNGAARLVREIPGLTNLKLRFGVPKVSSNQGGPLGALVECTATWQIDGTAHELEQTFPIRINQGQGGDAILGKAKRKLLTAVYNECVDSEHAITDGDIDDPPMVTQGDVIDDMKSKVKAAQEVSAKAPATPEPEPASETPAGGELDAAIQEMGFQLGADACKDALASIQLPAGTLLKDMGEVDKLRLLATLRDMAAKGQTPTPAPAPAPATQQPLADSDGQNQLLPADDKPLPPPTAT